MPLNNSGQYGKFKLYSLKIWDDGTLARNFVPCVSKEGVAGLHRLCRLRALTRVAL